MIHLVHRETMTFDTDVLDAMALDLGIQSVERRVGAALDDIFDGLCRVRIARAQGRRGDVHGELGSIAASARAIGLGQLARVADDAATASDRADGAAAGATLARLERLFDGAAQAIGRGWSATS